MRQCARCSRLFDDAVVLCPDDGADLRARPSLRGRTLDGSYRIESLIATGGSGAVYRGTQLGLDRPVAVKVLRTDLAGTDGAAERFHREALAIARLRHPNVVTAIDFGVDAEAGAYLVFELLEGRTLDEELRLRDRVDLATACRIVRDVCEALDAAHRIGIVHGDVCARNVFLDTRSAGEPVTKLVDFGVAGLLGDAHATVRDDVRAAAELLTALVRQMPHELQEAIDDASSDEGSIEAAGALSDAISAGLDLARAVLPQVSNNLPRIGTSFVGREHEIATVARLVETERIVTLVGPGGIGKTRLSIAVAERVARRFPDGVWFVELASVADSELIADAVARALGIREPSSGTVIQATVEHLQNRSALVVLDNCEHLIESCAELVEALTRQCPAVHVLVSSQEVLRIPGETISKVPVLTVPEAGGSWSLAALARFESVRLFVDRARRFDPSFELTSGKAAAVARICQRLEGVPLAIELAVARLGQFGLDDILDRLDDRLEFLSSDAEAVPYRHRTLRATLDWSFELLAVRERILLERLSVFATSCTIDALESVCAGGMLGQANVVEVLSSLVDRSLVRADTADPEPRFSLLETVRQYAAERLSQSGERRAVLGRFVAWAIDLARRAESGLTGPAQSDWLERIERDHANVRAAVRAATLELADADASLRLVGALERYLAIRGHLSEGRAWYENALALGIAPGLEAVGAKALYGAGALAAAQGDYVEAARLFERSLPFWEQASDPVAHALTLNRLGDTAESLGDYTRARALYGDALALSEREQDRLGLARSLFGLGLIALDGSEFEEAVSYFERSLALSREVGNDQGVATTLHNLGEVELRRGELDRAAELLQASLELTTRLGDRRTSAYTAVSLGHIALEQGQSERAAELYERARALHAELGNRTGVACALEGLAGALAPNQPLHALACLDEASRLRGVTRTVPTPAERVTIDRTRTRIATALEA